MFLDEFPECSALNPDPVTMVVSATRQCFGTQNQSSPIVQFMLEKSLIKDVSLVWLDDKEDDGVSITVSPMSVS